MADMDDDDDLRCPGCGGSWALISRNHRCSGHLLKAKQVGSGGGGGANPQSLPKGTSDLSGGGRQEMDGSKGQSARKGEAEHQAVSNPRRSNSVPVRGQVDKSARAGVASRSPVSSGCLHCDAGVPVNKSRRHQVEGKWVDCTKPKRGRPRLDERRVDAPKPWVSLGISERTYYRRKAEK